MSSGSGGESAVPVDIPGKRTSWRDGEISAEPLSAQRHADSPTTTRYDEAASHHHIDDLNPDNGSLGAVSHFSADLSVDSDGDSALGDDSPLSTSSLRSSIYEFVVGHGGRTFHRYKQGARILDAERQDLQHAIFLKLLNGKLGLAPIENPQSVLDIGTGTGIWAIEFATQFPSASVIGSDLSPIQPEYVPVNCRFEVDDAEDDWVFGRKFDYVHLRLMFHAFRSHPAVMKETLKNLQPGGWMEWQDYYCIMQAVDDTIRGTALERWCHLYVEAGGRLGRDMQAPRKYKRWMEEAGFVNVNEDRLAIPGNPWPKGDEMKQMGLWQMCNFLDGIHAVTMTVFTKGLDMSPDQVELLLIDVRKDIKNLGCHFYFLTYIVYGQKPLRPSSEGSRNREADLDV